jgi:predicted lipase
MLNHISLLDLSREAKKAYLDQPMVKKSNIGYVEKNDIFVRIERYGPTTIIIAFRGTDSYQDWIYNLSRWKSSFLTEDDGIEVHTGFLNHMKDIYNDVTYEIQRVCANSIHLLQTVHITGHSLGGAVSVLYGAKLSQENPGLDIHVTTFGAPRVGNKKFKAWVQQAPKLYMNRIHNSWDIVTHLPYFGYVHVGKSLHIMTTVSKFRMLKNHSISTYIESI